MYPTLSETLQTEWDEAEQARYEDLITEQVKTSVADQLQADEMYRCTRGSLSDSDTDIKSFVPFTFQSSALLVYNFFSSFSNLSNGLVANTQCMFAAGIQQSFEGYF